MAGMRYLRTPLVCLLLALGPIASACEKPDASFTTSPSARALLGVTGGNLALSPGEPLPPAAVASDGWDIELGVARFAKLENDTRALIVVATVNRTQPGAGMELWLARDGVPVTRWSGGSSRPYAGTLCFQLALEDKDRGEAILLAPGAYTLTVAFRDPDRGVVYAKQNVVTHQPPQLAGSPPAGNSPVFRTLLSCPRGS